MQNAQGEAVSVCAMITQRCTVPLINISNSRR